MPYFTSQEPVFYYSDPINIVWQEENSGIPSNDNRVTEQPKVDTEPTSSDQPTIQVTSTSQMMHNETYPSDDCDVSMNKPCTSLPLKEVKVKDFLKELQLLQRQMQDFKQLINDMKRIKNQIYDMLPHMHYHIDTLLDIKNASKILQKLECISCGKKFVSCTNFTSKNDGNHLGEVALPPSKKKKVTATYV